MKELDLLCNKLSLSVLQLCSTTIGRKKTHYCFQPADADQRAEGRADAIHVIDRLALPDPRRYTIVGQLISSF